MSASIKLGARFSRKNLNWDNTWFVGDDQYNLQPTMCAFWLEDSNSNVVLDMEYSFAADGDVTDFTHDNMNLSYYPDIENTANYKVYDSVTGMDVNMNLNVPPEVSVTVEVIPD